MKLRIISDIHLDHYKPSTLWYPPEIQGDDDTILIIAGDVGIGTKWIDRLGFSWIGVVAQRFKQVLIVLGNHDYWPMGDLTIESGGNKCNSMLQEKGLYNVRVLDCDTFESEGVVFVGATLWTDMNRQDPLVMGQLSNIMRYDGKLKFKTAPGGYYERFTPLQWTKTHYTHKDYIDHVAKENKDKKVVVITHHLPLTTMENPFYRDDISNAYYSSDCSKIILGNENINLWICGHTHSSKDFMFDHCRMFMNSIGYPHEYLPQEHKVIEI